MRSMRRSLCAAMLSLQAVALFLVWPVLTALTAVPAGVAAAVGLGFTVACLVVVGLLRHPWGYALGWAVQASALVLGVVVPGTDDVRVVVIGLGVVFAGLWTAAYLLGGRVDRERAAATPT